VQALVDDGVLHIQGRRHLIDIDLDAEVQVLKRNDQENIADDKVEAAEAAEAAEAEVANQDLILLILDAMQA
jgi:hypothetical protein